MFCLLHTRILIMDSFFSPAETIFFHPIKRVFHIKLYRLNKSLLWIGWLFAGKFSIFLLKAVFVILWTQIKIFLWIQQTSNVLQQNIRFFFWEHCMDIAISIFVQDYITASLGVWVSFQLTGPSLCRVLKDWDITGGEVKVMRVV